MACIAFFGIGIAYGTQVHDWSVIDSMYWMMVTVTTVGYGDYSPKDTHDGMKYAACIFILVGITVVMDTIQGLMHAIQDDFKVSMIKESDKVGAEELERKIYPVQGMMRLAAVLVLGTAFFSHNEGWEFADAFYWCVCTATTVGYGDMKLKEESSRAFSIVFVLLSISQFGGLLQELGEISMRNRWDFQQAKVKDMVLTEELIEKMDVDGDDEVTSGEFLSVCLAEMGLVSVKDCRFFLEKFKELDVDNGGTLNREDLRQMSEQVTEHHERTGMDQRVGSFHRKKFTHEMEGSAHTLSSADKVENSSVNPVSGGTESSRTTLTPSSSSPGGGPSEVDDHDSMKMGSML
jgi:hypothetical protein